MQQYGTVNKRISQFYFLYFRIIFSILSYFYLFHEHFDAFCFFFLQKDFCVVHNHIFAICFYLLQKDFDNFHEAFFEVFVFLIIST